MKLTIEILTYMAKEILKRGFEKNGCVIDSIDILNYFNYGNIKTISFDIEVGINSYFYDRTFTLYETINMDFKIENDEIIEICINGLAIELPEKELKQLIMEAKLNNN